MVCLRMQSIEIGLDAISDHEDSHSLKWMHFRGHDYF